MVDNANSSPKPNPFDNVLSSFEAAPENKNESTWTKVSREAYVLGGGLALGFGSGAAESAHDPWGTALRVGTAVGTGVALAVLTRGGSVPALIAEAAGAGMAASFALDVVKPERIGALANVAADTWRSDANTKANIGVVSDQLGRFAFDTALMSVGAVGGGMAFKGRPFFEESNLFRAPKAPTYEQVTSGSYGATSQFLTRDAGRELPSLDVFPDSPLTPPKYSRVLTASTLALPMAEIRGLDRLSWLRDEGKSVSWKPSEPTISARVEAQNFVKAFMAKDYHAALTTSIEAKVLERVELNPEPKLQSVEIKADELKDPLTLQYHMSQIAKVGVFDWRQTTSGADILESRLRVKVPRTVVELNDGGAKVALVDFSNAQTRGYNDGYKVVYPNETVTGQKLTPSQQAEIEAIRKSPEGQRVLAETAIVAFEESIAHANQHITAGGDLISPTYARYQRDFGAKFGTRPQFLSFLNMLGKEHPQKVWFNEQEVAGILYDAGMPLPVIEHHYFFGGRHVEERTPLFKYLRDNEANPAYDYHGPQAEAPEKD